MSIKSNNSLKILQFQLSELCLVILFLSAFTIANLLAEEIDPKIIFDISLEELTRIKIENQIRTPMGVQHIIGEGITCFCYNYQYMDMNGNRSETHSVSALETLNNFMVTPTQMTIESVMVGVMHGLTENLTLYGMLLY